jgi:hypothetical protein
MVVKPAMLELAVGDSVYSPDLRSRLEIIGLTAAGDTVQHFATLFALQPNPFLEHHGGDYLARRAGTATLWIYIGSEPPRRPFTDTTRAARVQIRIK